MSPVRILLATDAASEGLDLQNFCSRLIHHEIPWNPNRLEQRNGRVDRPGQRRTWWKSFTLSVRATKSRHGATVWRPTLSFWRGWHGKWRRSGRTWGKSARCWRSRSRRQRWGGA
ncbi:MAG: helicase-related protein [Acidobacteriota bacterium]|nr:helicase-related protein [Acidobacteriota bacterium]